MEELKNLNERGWYLTNDGFKKVIGDPSINKIKDVTEIVSTIMNMDFRDIAGGALPIKRDDTIPGRIVLQLQKSRNISAPKSNEESKVAPRFLQLELTDGQTAIQALEFENIPSLSLNLPPGTKIYLRAERLQLFQGFLILRASELQILGGQVESLVEKWEFARSMQKYVRSGLRVIGAMGPPPWIAFGKKVDLPMSDERNFKSLQTGLVEGKESKENEEFNTMRNEAIAEATKTGAKKVFGGGGQQMIDHNIKKILEKGYSEENAKQALRATNNNLERALYNLKRRAGDKRNDDTGSYKNSSINSYASLKTNNRSVNSRETNCGKRVLATFKEEVAAAKPMSNVSLYDFLTDKLSSEIAPIGSSKNTAALLSSSSVGEAASSVTQFEKPAKSNAHSKFENNMSSSFAANRSTEIKNRCDSVRSSRSGRNIDCLQDSDNTHNERINKNERITSFQTKLNNNPNQSGRKNRSIQDRTGVNTKNLISVGENDNSNFVKKRTNSPRRNRGGEERLDAYTRDKDRYNKSDHVRSNKLVETTSKYHIFDKNRDEPKGPSKASKGIDNFPPKQSYPQDTLQQLQNPISNGLQYDTSKIIGFQNKEANEMAMTLLKSQNMGTASVFDRKLQHPLNPRQLSASEQFSTSYMPPVPSHMQTSSHLASTYLTPVAAYAIPSPQAVQTVATIPSHFGMVPGNGWQWKCGDLCFAKYWDDGRYYEAEVTAVSEKTCVVFFLGYGNHEEVLKSDCLPITDANHHPVNNYNSEEQQQLPVSRPQQIQIGTVQRGGSSQRLRGERQVYVPPPKRDN